MRRHDDHADVTEGDFIWEVFVIVLWIIVAFALLAVNPAEMPKP